MAQSLKDKLIKHFIDWLVHEKKRDSSPLCDFERISYEVRPGDVLLTEGRSRISQVICNITQSSWSHSALYIGRLHDIENPILRDRVKSFYDGKNEDQLIIESVLGKGTVVVPLSTYRDEHIRICRPVAISRSDAQAVIGYTIGRLGMEYDLRHVLDLARFLVPWTMFPRRWRSSLFKRNIGTPTRIICSTLIAEAFHSVHYPILPMIKPNDQTGVELIHRNPRLFTPSDFDYSPFFDIIKYPIIDVSERAIYRHLPWNQETNMHTAHRGGFIMPNASPRVEEPSKEASAEPEESDPKDAPKKNGHDEKAE